MSAARANGLQALIFLLPHVTILGSILGPWMLHATANVTTALLVAMQ
jgi:hypothetical protein